MRFAAASRLLSTDLVPVSDTTVDGDYPLANLKDLNPLEVTRWETDAETRLVWDLGASPAVTLEGLLIVMHTFLAGSTLKVQANDTDAWGSPAFSQDLVVPTWTVTNSWVLPPNLVADFRGTALATAGYRYLSLLLPAQPTVDHAIGEICWITEWQQPASSLAWPVQRAEIRRVNVNMTSYGVDHVVDRGVQQRRLTLRFGAISDADRDLWLALVREVGASEAWVLVLDVHETTDFHASAEALLVRFHADSIGSLIETLQFFGVHDLTLDVIEVQRGLAL